MYEEDKQYLTLKAMELMSCRSDDAPMLKRSDRPVRVDSARKWAVLGKEKRPESVYVVRVGEVRERETLGKEQDT